MGALGESARGESARYKAGRYRALRNLVRGNASLVERAKGAGALAEWL